MVYYAIIPKEPIGIIGPFETWEQAQEYYNEHLEMHPSQIVSMEAPMAVTA